MKNLIHFAASLISQKRSNKVIIMFVTDVLILQLSIFLSFYFRLEIFYYPNNLQWVTIYLIPLFILPIFYSFSVYQEIIRYFGLRYLTLLFQAVSFYALLWGISIYMIGLDGFPRSVVFIHWAIAFFLLIFSRLIAKNFLNTVIDNLDINHKVISKKNILIYGAGVAGIQIANSLSHNKEFKLKAYLDDDLSLQNQLINSIPVFSPKKIKKIIDQHEITELFVAIPSISKLKKQEVIDMAIENNFKIKILPSIKEISKYKYPIEFEDLRSINIEDLLGRDQIKPDVNLMNHNIKNKNILITGAGGSIGSEICRQVLDYSPGKVILYEINEYSLFKIYSEFKLLSKSIEIVPILGSTLNSNHLASTIKKFKVQTIYHSAAYKHVPIFEYNVIQGVYNNIISTYNCINTAILENVETLVMISTDKAVRPSSNMGASKRFSEMLMQAINLEKNINKKIVTNFISVRFGNVLGSSGSVIPTFEEQIKNGGPITLTDRKIVRYFMTSKEAAQLVIQAGAIGNGGEIFLLDMGQPILIYDLAKKWLS